MRDELAITIPVIINIQYYSWEKMLITSIEQLCVFHLKKTTTHVVIGQKILPTRPIRISSGEDWLTFHVDGQLSDLALRMCVEEQAKPPHYPHTPPARPILTSRYTHATKTPRIREPETGALWLVRNSCPSQCLSNWFLKEFTEEASMQQGGREFHSGTIR